jgi:hypothetical protein
VYRPLIHTDISAIPAQQRCKGLGLHLQGDSAESGLALFTEAADGDTSSKLTASDQDHVESPRSGPDGAFE